MAKYAQEVQSPITHVVLQTTMHEVQLIVNGYKIGTEKYPDNLNHIGLLYQHYLRRLQEDLVPATWFCKSCHHKFPLTTGAHKVEYTNSEGVKRVRLHCSGCISMWEANG